MKRILSAVLCLVMLFTCCVVIANADTYTIDINSTDAKSGTGWSWDGTTLALNNYSGGAIGIHNVDSATITLTGTNTVSGNAYGIDTNASITFTGAGNLTVTAANPAIRTEGGSKNVAFSGSGTITLTSTELEGIFVDGQVAFNSGTVSITGASGMPAVVAYDLQKKDNLRNIMLDTYTDDYGFSKGSDQVYMVNGTETALTEKDIGGTAEEDGYTTDSYVKDAYGNTYNRTKVDNYYVINKYDSYGNLVDSYADNATQATWSWTSSYKLKTLSTSTVGIENMGEHIYSGAVVRSITVQKKETPPPTTEKITSNVYPLKNAGSTPVVDKVVYGTTVDQFKNNLTNANSKLKVYNLSGKEVTGSTVVGTKFIVKLFIDGKAVDQRTIVVLGDVYNDAILNSQDYQMIRQHIMETRRITDPILMLAADAYNDGNIDSRDYQKIKQIIMSR